MPNFSSTGPVLLQIINTPPKRNHRLGFVFDDGVDIRIGFLVVDQFIDNRREYFTARAATELCLEEFVGGFSEAVGLQLLGRQSPGSRFQSGLAS